MSVDDISESVAKKLGLSELTVKHIARMQWKMLHKEIQSGEFNPVQIFYLGKFFKNKKYNKDGIKRDIGRFCKLHISKRESGGIGNNETKQM